MRSTTTGEERLVRALRSGDSRAFRQVYDTYHPAIYNLCARIVGDREEAKDLTQETFLRAFSTPPEPRAEVGLRPWLYRVATNLSLNHLRATRGGGTSGGAEIEQVAAPVDGFQQAQIVALVEETLGQLNDRYRTALVLKDLHGLPSEELAGVMDMSRASADVLVHRARASFRSVFSRLAGEGNPAPGNLAMVLAPLAVPAALQVVPPLPHGAAPAVPHPPAPLPAHPVHPIDGSGGGLLARLSSGLGPKVAVAAATASLVIGGVATERMITHSRHDQARTAAVPATVADQSSTATGSAALTASSDHWLEHWVGHGCPTGDASCTSDHLNGGDHHGETDSAGHTAEHSGDAAGTAHEAATHDSTGAHDSGTGTAPHDSGTGATTGEHDAGTTSGGTGAGAGSMSGTPEAE